MTQSVLPQNNKCFVKIPLIDPLSLCLRLPISISKSIKLISEMSGRNLKKNRFKDLWNSSIAMHESLRWKIFIGLSRAQMLRIEIDIQRMGCVL